MHESKQGSFILQLFFLPTAAAVGLANTSPDLFHNMIDFESQRSFHTAGALGHDMKQFHDIAQFPHFQH